MTRAGVSGVVPVKQPVKALVILKPESTGGKPWKNGRVIFLN